jgi:hypothetical protein
MTGYAALAKFPKGNNLLLIPSRQILKPAFLFD